MQGFKLLRGSQRPRVWGLTINFSSCHNESELGTSLLGLIQTYMEHESARAVQEWQDIKVVWALHKTTFIRGTYTKKEFLWIPEESNLSELFFDKSERVLSIKQAIYRAMEFCRHYTNVDSKEGSGGQGFRSPNEEVESGGGGVQDAQGGGSHCLSQSG